MFKLLVLSALLAIAAAVPHVDEKPSASTLLTYSPYLKTSLIHEPVGHVAISEPTYTKVGDYVESVPTAVSHQSSTIVHKRANVVRPIIAPAVRTQYAPLVRSYAAPMVHSYEYPLASYYTAPYYVHGYNQQQLYKSLA